MAVIRTAPATTTLIYPKLKPKPLSFHSQSKSSPQISLKLRCSTKSPSLHLTAPSIPTKKPQPQILPLSFPSLHPIMPYVQSEWKPILKGWICSAISVYCLSKMVPKVGKLSVNLSNVDLEKEGVVLGLLVLVRLVVKYWQQAFLWDAALNSAYKIRVFVYDKVLQRDLGFFEGRGGVPAGDIAYRITSEASDVADTVYALLNSIVPSALQLTTMVTQMVVLSPVLTLITTLAIPIFSLGIAYLGKRLHKLSKNAHLSAAKLSGYLNEVLPSILFVKANSAELCESTRFQRLAHADLSEQLKKKKMKALIPQVVQVIYVGALSIFCIGALVVLRGVFDGSSFVSFMTSMFLLIDPIQGVGKAYDELKQGEPAVERLFDLTTFSSQVIQKPDAVDLDSVTGDVKFCDVSFMYGDNMPAVLNKLNLHIKPGETVALVGPSGGGKTTLSKLLLRLYDPHCGSVLIDNHDIRNIRLENLRRHVGIVSQDITLFSGTVAENIGYRDLMSKIDMERVVHAAQTANADEFISKLSEGYNTNIGQRGSILSGGQKQRLAIARAIYQNSSVLIMDEATSALDSKSELLVRQALERLLHNHTVLVIAHRLETIMMADRIVLLENGKLEEVTRASLLTSSSHNGLLTSTQLVI